MEYFAHTFGCTEADPVEDEAGADLEKWLGRHSSPPKGSRPEPRRSGQPVAIKNVGNSCYLSSLLQSYYMLPSFYRLILVLPDNSRVVRLLQNCFAKMTGSARHYISPHKLFQEL